jgi:competence protein ComEC
MISIALGFVGGAWLLQQQSVLPSLPMTLFLLLSASTFSLADKLLHIQSKAYPLFRTVRVLIIGFILGFVYAAISAEIRLSDELPKGWEQKNIQVVGVVASIVKVSPRGERFLFNIEQIITPNAQAPTKVLLNHYQQNTWFNKSDQIEKKTLSKPAKFSVGERWQLTIKLKRPHTTYNPNGYDFEAWALAHQIRAMGTIRSKSGLKKIADFVWRPRYMVEFCREKVANRLTSTLKNKPYVGVIRALVVGDDSQINHHDWQVYLHTGVNHLMSISGLHITMLAGLAFAAITYIWRHFPHLVLWMPTRKAATLGGGLIALLYACLAGLSVPTQRTLFMLATFAIALLLNRKITIAIVLAIALMVVVLFDPWAVVSPGFWLSFSAVAFIAYATANRLRMRHWLAEAVNTQWSVTLGLLPFLLAMFGQASIISPVANAFAIPVISLLVVPLSIIGALLPFDFILQIAHQILVICMIGLNWLSELPFATWQQAQAPNWTIVLGLVGVLWWLLPRGFPQRWLGFILILPMLLIQPKPLSQGEMRVSVLDVGQGLSVVIQTARHVMLYDTGQEYSQDTDAGSSIIVPYLQSQGVQKLDALVVSHDDNDHSGGLASVLAQLPVEWTAASYILPNDVISTITQSALPAQLQCYAGQKWLWDGVRFEVLYPDNKSYQDATIKDNDRSCVIKVTSRNGTLLLTGDIEAKAEAALLKNYKYKLNSDVLVVPHHGSKTSSTEAFIASVSAKYTIFTVGYLNRFNHPKPLILSRYLENRSTLYRSDYDGAILIDYLENQAIQVQAWRKENAKYWHDKYL